MAPAGYGARVEGIHAVAAAVDSGRVTTLTVESRRRDRPDIAALIDKVSDVRYVVDARKIADSDAPQGLVADCRPILPVGLDSLAIEKAAILVLDHLEDPQNVGAVARSAAAAGCTGMVISGRRAAPLSASAFKAAAGALERLPIAVVGSIPEALKRLKSQNVWVVGLDTAGTESIFGLELLTESVAVVVGAEGEGLSQLVAKRCDVLASIPMADQTESLNASVSAALAVFEIMRMRSERMPLPG
jgi:23S rRNA (guanosine2251-2'-O)-methyltransferase